MTGPKPACLNVWKMAWPQGSTFADASDRSSRPFNRASSARSSVSGSFASKLFGRHRGSHDGRAATPSQAWAFFSSGPPPKGLPQVPQLRAQEFTKTFQARPLYASNADRGLRADRGTLTFSGHSPSSVRQLRGHEFWVCSRRRRQLRMWAPRLVASNSPPQT